MTLWISFVPFQLEKRKKQKKKNTVHKNSVFFSACYVCACETTVLSKTVQIFFSYPRKKKKEERKKGKPSTGLSSLKSVFRLASFDSNFKTPSSDFPIEYAGLLSLEVSGELPWQWLLLSLYTLTHFFKLNFSQPIPPQNPQFSS